ncbi:hypothetical protein ACO3UB_00765 [Methanocaldococcus sp. 16A]
MVAKRWDTRIYDINEILEVFDDVMGSIKLPKELKPRKYCIELLLKVSVIKEFLGVSLRAMEILTEVFFGAKIDHSVIYYWEKKLNNYIISIVNQILRKLWSFYLRHTLRKKYIPNAI